jgi:hypothetical protein
MTSAQVEYILDELNSSFSGMYTVGDWLEAEEIASIILASDESVYPDETMQIKFDSENELLLTRVGSYDEEGVFQVLKDTAAIEYSLIVGISMARPGAGKSPYKNGSAV